MTPFPFGGMDLDQGFSQPVRRVDLLASCTVTSLRWKLVVKLRSPELKPRFQCPLFSLLLGESLEASDSKKSVDTNMLIWFVFIYACIRIPSNTSQIRVIGNQSLVSATRFGCFGHCNTCSCDFDFGM